jgi:hypothetical protein
MREMKKMKMFFLLMVILLAGVVSAFAAEDCRIIQVDQIGLSDYRITFDLSSIRTAERTPPIFHGQKAPHDAWIFYEGVSYIGESRIATVEIHNWISGEEIEFSTGAMYGDIVWYTTPDPTCCAYVYPVGAPPGEMHYRVRLGEKVQSVVVSPSIQMLLLNKKHSAPVVHPCAVVSVVESGVNGDLANYAITLSLQKFADAPADAVAYVDRQQAPNSAWTGFQAVTRQGDTAILTVTGWPRGSAMEFSYKLAVNGTDYWQDIAAWQTSSCTAVYGDHFQVVLGN